MLEDRTINVSWNEKTIENKKYLTLLVIYTNTLENKIADLVQKTSMMNISIESIKTIGKEDGFIYEGSIYVRDVTHLNKLLLEYEKTPYISRVERLMR